MTEIPDPMDPKAAYEAAYKAIRAGDASRIREVVAAAHFLVTNDYLKEEGYDEALLNQAISYGMRSRARLEVVEAILDLGADVNYCPPWGCTALYEAAMCQDVAMVRFLLKRGADPNIREFPLDEDDPNTVLDCMEWEILLQETRMAGEPDHDPGEVMPMIRDMLKQAGAKGYYERTPEGLKPRSTH